MYFLSRILEILNKKYKFVFHIMKVHKVIWTTFKWLFLPFSGAFISFLFNNKHFIWGGGGGVPLRQVWIVYAIYKYQNFPPPWMKVIKHVFTVIVLISKPS